MLFFNYDAKLRKIFHIRKFFNNFFQIFFNFFILCWLSALYIFFIFLRRIGVYSSHQQKSKCALNRRFPLNCTAKLRKKSDITKFFRNFLKNNYYFFKSFEILFLQLLIATHLLEIHERAKQFHIYNLYRLTYFGLQEIYKLLYSRIFHFLT